MKMLAVKNVFSNEPFAFFFPADLTSLFIFIYFFIVITFLIW